MHTTSWILFGCLALALGGWACQNQPSAADAAAPTAAAGWAPQSDSVDILYRRFYASRRDSLPTAYRPEVGKINPVDEAPLDSVFFVFRERLRQLVKEKNVLPLMELVADDIRISFGDQNGKMAFIQTWGLTSPTATANSPLWAVLEQVLALGGSFGPDRLTFTAPYYFAHWPTEADPFGMAVVTGSGVRLREAPNLQAPMIGRLSYDLVEVLTETPDSTTIEGLTYPWYQVKNRAGLSGYLFGQYLGWGAGWRAGFTRTPAGAWVMDMLISGD